MLANCGKLGLEWRYLSLSSYLEALEAFNDAAAAEGQGGKVAGDPEQLQRVMKARLGPKA